MAIQYEWCIETYLIDADEDDITNNHFSDELKSYEEKDFIAETGEAVRLCLVRNEGNEVEGLTDRYWAYVKDGKLPDTFEDGSGTLIAIDVPKKFHAELARFTLPGIQF